MRLAAWLGFWAMGDWYQGFPLRVSATMTNLLLVLAGALQWGLVGLAWDLGRSVFRKPRRLGQI
jgi:hypothetical protein